MPQKIELVPGVTIDAYLNEFHYFFRASNSTRYSDEDGHTIVATPTGIEKHDDTVPISLTFVNSIRRRDIATILRKMADMLDTPNSRAIKTLGTDPTGPDTAVRMYDGRVRYFNWNAEREEDEKLIHAYVCRNDHDDDEWTPSNRGRK